MSRRKTVSTNVLEKLIKKQEQPIKDFQQASEEFFKHCRIKGLSPDTVLFYQKELKGLFRAWAEINVSLNDVRILTTQDLENWVEYMLDHNRAISSINARLRAGRTFMNYCLKKDYIDKNPFDGIQQLKKRHTVGATFTKKQLNKLLDTPNITQFVGLRDLAIMLTFAHVGLRLKELCSLKFKTFPLKDQGKLLSNKRKTDTLDVFQ